MSGVQGIVRVCEEGKEGRKELRWHGSLPAWVQVQISWMGAGKEG